MCAQLTTGFQFRTDKSAELQSSSQVPFRVLIIGAFGGVDGSRANNSEVNWTITNIDKDNFDSVFAEKKVGLNSAFSDEPLPFECLDDFHPDVMFERLPIFTGFQRALKRLKKCKSYSEGVAILQSAGLNAVASIASNQTKDLTSSASGAVDFDTLLESNIDHRDTIQQLIKDIVRPFSESKTDGRVEELQEVLVNAIGRSMRALLQTLGFRQLESIWRSLDFINRRLDTDKTTQLYILDVSDEVLTQELTQLNIESSQLYLALTVASQNQPLPRFDVVVCDMANHKGVEDSNLLNRLQKLTSQIGADLYLDFDFKVAGCQEILEQPQVTAWSSDAEISTTEPFCNWQALCKHCTNIYAFAPKILLRMPYGEKTSPLESFKFEELQCDANHEAWRSDFLWGSATIAALIFAERFYLAQNRLDQVDIKLRNLPFFALDLDGETLVQPSTQVVMSDNTVSYLRALGVNSLLGSTTENALTLRSFHAINRVDNK